MNSNYLSINELQNMGLQKVGKQVLISRDARLLSPQTISIGNNVLIDAFTIINGNVIIGNHVHISSHCEVYGGKDAQVIFKDYSAISSHTSVYGQSDEYIEPYLHNPTVPSKCRKITNKTVILGKCVLVGAHCMVLPGVTLGDGCSFGACSLINKSTQPGGLYAGAPCKRIFNRDLQTLMNLASEVDKKKKE